MAASAQSTVYTEAIRFVEADGAAAGTYTGTCTIPARAVLIDVIVHGTALWTAGTSATLTVGDATTTNGIFTAVDLKATDLLAGESLSFYEQGGKKGADLDSPITASDAAQVRRRMLTAERVMQAKVITVGTVGTAGDTTVVFVYAYPSPARATFA